MSYITQKTYVVEKSILFNNRNTNNLNQVLLKAKDVGLVGQYRYVLQGSVMTDKGLLKRSNLLGSYVSGETTIVVDNPWVFAVGDVLYEIGTKDNDRAAENLVVSNGTAQPLGVITAINAANVKQETEIIPSAIAIGDTIVVDFDDRLVSYTAKSADIGEFVEGLVKALPGNFPSDHDLYRFVDLTQDGTKVIITSKEAGCTFKIDAEISGTGSVEVNISQPFGEITITPDSGNNDHAIGAKIGTIDQYPVGIIAQSYYLTDDVGQDKNADVAPYDMANVNLKALPYMDGQIANALSNIRLTPAYGQN